MFLETLVAVFLLGWLVAFAFLYLVNIRPLERQLRDMHRHQLREMRMRRYRSEIRRKHLGTPYLASTRQAYVPPEPTEFERLLADLDDHNGSRKAPELRVVS